MKKKGIINRFEILQAMHKDLSVEKTETRPYLKNMFVQNNKLIGTNAHIIFVYDLQDYKNYVDGFYIVNAGDILLTNTYNLDDLPHFDRLLNTERTKKIETASIEYVIHKLNENGIFLSLKYINLINKYKNKIGNLYMQIEFNTNAAQAVKFTLDSWLVIYVMPIAEPTEH
jgi:hypothetical protein